MHVYFDLKQTTSVDSLVSVHAENDKNVWKILCGSTLNCCVSLVTLVYFSNSHYLLIMLGYNAIFMPFVQSTEGHFVHYAIKRFRLYSYSFAY